MKKVSLIKGRKGYILPWVMILFLLVSVLSTVIVSASAVALRSTATTHNVRQAYYTARSAAGVVVDYILKNGNDKDALDLVLNDAGSGSNDLLGDYTVEVYGISDTRLKVTAKALYQGEQSTVTATLVRQAGGPSPFNPNDNLIYMAGGSITLNPGIYNGDIYVHGDLTLTYGTKVNGRIIVTGKTTVEGGSDITLPQLISFGDVEFKSGGKVSGDVITNGKVRVVDGANVGGNVSAPGDVTIKGSVNGDVYSKGDIFMSGGGGWIGGNLYADGSLHMQSGSDYIVGDAVIGGSAYFGGGGDRVQGSLSYGGSVTVAYGSISTFVPGGATKITDYQPLELEDLSKYERPAGLPIVSPPTAAQAPALYQPLTVNGTTISSSGSITSAVLAKLDEYGINNYGSTITIDTSAGDISLLVKDTTFFVDRGFKYEVTGPNRVYIYLTGSSSLVLGANQYMGMRARGSNPRLFIIGDGNQTVRVVNNSELNACVYLPAGRFEASGDSLIWDNYKFIGVIMADTTNVTSNLKFQYSSADLVGTPLEGILEGSSGGSGGSSGGWKLGGWDNR